ncbi:MAG: hypothetical protein HZB17_13850, partial [Chloroflexi bacterium]|nr:hypothetical protein [Chloroflexota bacterium]
MFNLSLLRLRTRLTLLFISMIVPPLILIVYGEWGFANTPAAGSMIVIGVTSLV